MKIILVKMDVIFLRLSLHSLILLSLTSIASTVSDKKQPLIEVISIRGHGATNGCNQR